MPCRGRFGLTCGVGDECRSKGEALSRWDSCSAVGGTTKTSGAATLAGVAFDFAGLKLLESGRTTDCRGVGTGPLWAFDGGSAAVLSGRASVVRGSTGTTLIVSVAGAGTDGRGAGAGEALTGGGAGRWGAEGFRSGRNKLPPTFKEAIVTGEGSGRGVGSHDCGGSCSIESGFFTSDLAGATKPAKPCSLPALSLHFRQSTTFSLSTLSSTKPSRTTR